MNEFKGRLGWKIIQKMLLVTLLIVALTTLVGYVQFKKYFSLEFVNRGKVITFGLAQLSSDAVQSFHNFLLQDYADNTKSTTKDITYVEIVQQASPSEKGEILADTIQSKVGTQVSDEFSDTIMKSTEKTPGWKETADGYDIGLRIMIADKPFGYVRIGLSNERLKKRIAAVGWLMVITAVVVFIAGAIYIGFSVSRNTAPMSDLVGVLKEMAQARGDLTQTVNVAPTGDEIEALARVTNQMRGGIRDIIREVLQTVTLLKSSTAEMANSLEMSMATIEHISSSITDVAGSTDKEASEVKQVFAVVKEISGVVSLAIKTADNNKRLAEEALNTISLIEDTITDPVAQKGFGRIKEAVQKSAHEISLVGTVTAELEKGNNMIVKRVEEILSLSQKNARSAEQVSSAAQEQTSIVQKLSTDAQKLRESAQNLMKSIENFKV